MRWAVLRGSPARRPISLNGRRGSLREKDARTRIALRRDLRPEPWEPRRLGNFRIVESYPGIWKRYARNRASVKGQCGRFVHRRKACDESMSIQDLFEARPRGDKLGLVDGSAPGEEVDDTDGVTGGLAWAAFSPEEVVIRPASGTSRARRCDASSRELRSIRSTTMCDFDRFLREVWVNERG